MPKHARITEPVREARLPLAVRVLLTLLLCILLVSSVALFFAQRYLFENWSELSVDEILFHIRTSIEGTNPEMVVYATLHYALPALALVVALLAVLWALRRHPRAFKAWAALLVVGSLGLFALSIHSIDQNTNLISYLRNPSSEPGDDFVENNFVDTGKVALTFPEKKRNLVYIYLESLEMTFADEAVGGAWPKNCIPELTQIALENEDFSGSDEHLNGAISLPGATWTMGGMFAQTSGLPLKLPLGENGMQRQTEFFPGITTLGDLLHQQGYTQELIIGSDATFGGRRLYFSTHGDYYINDYLEAQAKGTIPEGYQVSWGYEDEKLFEIAKQRLGELSAADEPFNLTLLTVDTHFEDGYVCDLCGTEFGDNQYANVFACSSRQVSAFVEWLQQQDFYEDTTVILCGDHITMDKDFCNDVPKDYQRRTFTAILNSVATPEDPTLTREYSTFDLFPTTLASLGVQIDGEQLGLGVNLYSTKPTLVEELGVEACEEGLGRQSSFLDRYSGIVIDEHWLDFTAEVAYIEPDTSGDTVVMRVENAGRTNVEAYDAAYLTLRDTRTGEVTEIPMDIVVDGTVSSAFHMEADTGLPAEDLPYLVADVSVDVKQFKHYPFLHYAGEAVKE